jgi:hypothetical protein
MTRLLTIAALIAAFAPAPALAQNPAPFRVQVHMGGDPALRGDAYAALVEGMQAARDVTVVDRNPEYIVSVLLVRTAGDTLTASVTTLSVHTADALMVTAQQWGLDSVAQQRLVAMFRGSGALADQRLFNGPALAPLAADIARAFVADTLAEPRRLRQAR